MKAPDRITVSQLEELPNIGKSMAGYLRLIGIHQPADLRGKNGYRLYDELCRVTGRRYDPCVVDVFLSVVDFMAGGDAQPWWHFTAERKEYMRENHSTSTHTVKAGCGPRDIL